MKALNLIDWEMETSSRFQVAGCTFATYISLNQSGSLDAEKIFVSLALFNTMRSANQFMALSC